MRALILGVLLACWGTQLGYAQSSDDPDAESKILALERIVTLQAYEAKDLRTLDTILDDAFVKVDPEGRLLSKPELLAHVQAVSVQYAVEAMVVRFHGRTAIVTGLYRIKGVERGKPLMRRGRFVDTWLNKDGRWVAIASLLAPNGE